MEKLNNSHIEAPKQSIFDFYNINNEYNFICENKNKPKEEVDFYLKEQVLKFLGEFVGKVKTTTINYQFRDDGRIYFPGSKDASLETYKKTAELAGESSRENAEYLGFSQIEKDFKNGANFSFWVSPPSNLAGFGNYGFVFLFEKKGNSIQEQIIRYIEEKGEIKNSQVFLPDKFKVNDFLSSPQSFKVLDIDFAKQQFYKQYSQILEMSYEEVKKSDKFNGTVKEYLDCWINDYIEALHDGNINKAKIVLTAIYNKATEIKKELEKNNGVYKSLKVFKENNDVYDYHYTKELLFYFHQNHHKNVSGGSCPVSSSEISNLFKQGINYTAASLLTGGLEKQKETWEYHKGNCVCCGSKDTEVGPCNICKSCEKKFD